MLIFFGGHGELQAAPVTLAVESCKFIQQQFPCFSLSVSVYSVFNCSSFLKDKKGIQIHFSRTRREFKSRHWARNKMIFDFSFGLFFSSFRCSFCLMGVPSCYLFRYLVLNYLFLFGACSYY